MGGNLPSIKKKKPKRHQILACYMEYGKITDEIQYKAEKISCKRLTSKF